MVDEQGRAAKRQMIALMQAGRPWQEAASIAGLHTSRSTAYRWFQQFRTGGEAGLQDGGHGHPSKVNEAILQWLEAWWHTTPSRGWLDT